MKTIAAIFIFGLWNLFTPNNENSNFKNLIYSYDDDSLRVSITSKDIIEGFKKLDSIACSKDLNISSLWFPYLEMANNHLHKYLNTKIEKIFRDYLKI